MEFFDRYLEGGLCEDDIMSHEYTIGKPVLSLFVRLFQRFLKVLQGMRAATLLHLLVTQEFSSLLIFALRTMGDKSEPRANRQLLYALTVEQPVP